MKKPTNETEVEYLSAGNVKNLFGLEKHRVFFVLSPDDLFNFDEFENGQCTQEVLLEWVQQKSMEEKEDVCLSRRINLIFPDFNNLEKDTVLPYVGIDYSITKPDKSFFLRMFSFGFGVLVLKKELLKYINLVELEAQEQGVFETWNEVFPVRETSIFWQCVFEGKGQNRCRAR